MCVFPTVQVITCQQILARVQCIFQHSNLYTW